MKFHVVTVANQWHCNLGKLMESCAKVGLPIQVLGMHGPYTGHNLKLKLVRDYIQQLPNDDIVLFVDAFDVLILEGERHILDCYRSFNYPLIMGGETNCWPFVERIPEFPECKTPYRFLNTGTYIGTVKSILELFCNLNIDDHLHACDQRTVMKFYLDHLTNHKLEDAPFILDTNCELFLPLFDLRDVIRLDISPTRVKCLNTGTFPCIIHANGKSFKHWDTIYDSIVHTNNGFRKAMNINNNVQMVCIDSGKKLSVNDKGEVVFAQDSFGWTLLPTDKPNEYFILDNVFGHALTARGHHNGAQLYLDEQRKTCWQVFPLDTGEVVISSNGFAIDDKGVKNKNEAIPAHLWEANWGNCNQLLRLTPL